MITFRDEDNMKPISYEDLLQAGKGAFNFSPDEDFKSVSQILEVASKNMHGLDYHCGASTFARRLAMYIDHNDFIKQL